VYRRSPERATPAAPAGISFQPARPVDPNLIPLPWVGAWGALAALTATLVTLRWVSWGWVGLVTAAAFGLLPWSITLTRAKRSELPANAPTRSLAARPAPVRSAEVSPLAGALPSPPPALNPGRTTRAATVVATSPQGLASLVPPPRPPTATRRAAGATDRLAAGAPQFQLLVRMLDDIDELEAEVSHAHQAAHSAPVPAEPSPRPLGSCADCELPYEGPEEVATTCRDCGGTLCVECAADAAAEGHRDRCEPCWTLETGLRGRSGSPRPLTPSDGGSAGATGPVLRPLRPVIGPGYGSTRP
jgi:hypothetical protein